MTLSKHQVKLLALLRQHGPIFVQSQRKPVGPKLMLDGTIWANRLAIHALEHKGAARRLDNGMLEAT